MQGRDTQATHNGMADSAQAYHNTPSHIIQQEGFPFSFNAAKCRECGGKCCYGESGYIFVRIAEIEQISSFLNMPFEDFCLRYVRKVGARFSLIEKTCQDREKGQSCVFFDEERLECAIYSVRPKQCRTFPFWSMYQHNQDELQCRCVGVILEDKA